MKRPFLPAPRRLAAALACLAFMMLAPAARSQEEPPDPEKEMEALLELLADRADQYREFALGFNCTESVIRSYYKAEKGTFKSREREVYDYIFTENEKTGELEEDRVLLEENGKKTRPISRDLNLGVPPPYAWSQIFSRKNQGRFLFKPAGKEIKSYRLLIHLDFVGAAATPGGRDIGGWSGRVSVDSSTLNLVSIVAEPSGQDARVEAEVMKYQRAFAIMGVPLASKPRTMRLEVTFGLRQQGLTYPTESVLEKNVYVRTGEQGREERTVMRYRDYRFFDVGTREEEARDAPTGGEQEGREPRP